MPRSRNSTAALLLAAAAAVPWPAAGADLTICVNAPTTLGGTPYEWNQTIDATVTGPPYALRFDGPAQGLAPDIHLDGLALLPGDRFLFSTASPFTIGQDTYQPSDVVRFEGAGVYSLVVAGAALGLGEDANVDSVALGPNGDLILSLDAPHTDGSTTYMPNDLLRVSGITLSLHVAGAALGLPEDLDVTGYEPGPGGTHLLQFDAPAELGATSFLPSDVAATDGGGSWSLYFRDPVFPSDAAGTDFSLACSGPGYSGLLRVGKTGITTSVSWSAGGAGLYDLVRGDLSMLRASAGDFTQALDAIVPSTDVCMVDDGASLAVNDAKADPTAGRGWLYVLRPVAGCGAGGSYESGGAGQVGLRDAEIAAAAADCP